VRARVRVRGLGLGGRRRRRRKGMLGDGSAPICHSQALGR